MESRAARDEEMMVRREWLMLVVLLLGGCRGYIVDHVNGKTHVLGAQLARYGLAETPCVAQRLDRDLTVWQTRQLADLAGRLSPGAANAAAFGPREFLYVAGLVEDPAVGRAAAAALAVCNLPVAIASPATPAARPAPADRPAEIAAAPATMWMNLGSARTGQGIAVDAASVTRGPAWRQAWFRLLNGNSPGASDLGYLLRIECRARTITAFGGRKYGSGGQLIEQKDYAAPEGPLPIEPGTVMDVAFQSLCYDPQ